MWKIMNLEILGCNHVLLIRLYISKLLFYVKILRFNLVMDFDFKAYLLDNWVNSLTYKNIINGFFSMRGSDKYITESDNYFRRGRRMKRIRRKRVHAYPF